MGKKFKVLTDVLDRIEHKAGFHEDGRPKKIVEMHRGDTHDFEGYEDEDVQRLVDLKAITPEKDEKAEDGKGDKSSSSDTADKASDSNPATGPNPQAPPQQSTGNQSSQPVEQAKG